jgi:hypothetical protein
VDELREYIADHDEADQRGLVDALVERFEQATGLDTSSIDTEAVEPELEPYVADNDEQ